KQFENGAVPQSFSGVDDALDLLFGLRIWQAHGKLSPEDVARNRIAHLIAELQKVEEHPDGVQPRLYRGRGQRSEVKSAEKTSDIFLRRSGDRFVREELRELLCRKSVSDAGIRAATADQQPLIESLDELVAVEHTTASVV